MLKKAQFILILVKVSYKNNTSIKKIVIIENNISKENHGD